MKRSDNISLQTIDFIIIGIAFLLTLFSWVYVIIEYPHLPEEIPSHFNHKGEADAYGSKSILWVIGALLTCLNIGLFFLAKATSFHNIQLKSKAANFRVVAIFMPFLSCIQCIAFYAMIASSKGTFTYSNWTLPIILILTFITLLITFTIIYKNK